jgi:PrtD family type I secretion system ABC transporter
MRYIDSGETLLPLGMVKGLIAAWQTSEDRNRADEQQLKETTNLILSFSRSLRLLLQIGILGLGAFYVLEAQLTAGAMIAASIVLGRALAPIERSITAWRRFTAARLAKNRLEQLFGLIEGQPQAVTLPRPTGALELDAVSYQEPRSGEPILRGVGFTLKPGETCAVIGPSGSGKSSLCRLLVGAWKPTLGHVRLDGVDVFDWISENLAPHIGYLPQQVELFPGSVAQNIARFGPLDSDKVIAAAKLTGVHELILELPQGYETEVDVHGLRISFGQRQRIALARALYDEPAFIVLDEPNSNLDSAGDQALTRALLALKKQGRTIVIVTHRPAALETANKVLLLREGSVAKFGERDEVLRLVMGQAPKRGRKLGREDGSRQMARDKMQRETPPGSRVVSVAE